MFVIEIVNCLALFWYDFVLLASFVITFCEESIVSLRNQGEL